MLATDLLIFIACTGRQGATRASLLRIGAEASDIRHLMQLRLIVGREDVVVRYFANTEKGSYQHWEIKKARVA
jgi:hypothetical protein